MVSSYFKEFIKDHGVFYSNMIMCPLKYHGYKITNNNILEVIEEIEYELSKFPEHSDSLLDHILNLKAQLKRPL